MFKRGIVQRGVNDKIVDLKNRTVMPGLIDMHVHLEHETNPNRYLEGFTLNPADYDAFQSALYAEKDANGRIHNSKRPWRKRRKYFPSECNQ